MSVSGQTVFVYFRVKMAERNGSNEASCFEFSERQLNQVTAAVVSVSGITCIACIIAVILIIVLKQYRTFLHRLVLYLMVAAGVYSLSFFLEITPVYHDSEGVSVRKGLEGLCAAIGFFTQIMAWIFHIIITWIVVYLTLLAVFKYQANKRKHEAIGLITVFVLPFAFNWIPFIQNMYGLSGFWCWIKPAEGGCNGDHTLGDLYQFGLHYAPAALVVIFTYVAFTTIVIVLCKERATTNSTGAAHSQAVKEALPLLAYPLIYNIFFVPVFVNRIYYAIAVSKGEKPNYPLFLAHAILEAMRMLLAALGFLLHPNILKKVFCKKPMSNTQRTATEFVVSNEFSEEEPLVIRGTTNKTECDTSTYLSIFEQAHKYDISLYQ